ncbi:MAG: Tetratricopeptide repeat protein [Actinomycetota bacterium]|nr:Tetratricopeptide repeat protein [Actinomycetota bacterium]
MNPTALRGAVDLGALARAREAKEARANAPAGAAASFVIDVGAESFQAQVLEQSMTVPVVLDLWADWCGPCKTLSPVLERLAAEYAGRFVLAKVDVDAEQEIAAAFKVQSIPSVFALIKGQPIPLFQGALPEPEVRQYLEELLRVAAENGVSGVAVGAPLAETSGEAAPAAEEDEGDLRLDVAAEAVAVGDWDAAEKAYLDILTADPGDSDATAGVALVRLQRRVEGVDFTAALQASDSAPGDIDKAIVAADVNLANGDAERAYARLIQAVRLSAGEERDRARAALVALFEMAPADDPAVTAARRSLAAALF